MRFTILFSFLLITTLCFFSGCKNNSVSADLILFNGKIFTGSDTSQKVTSVAVKNNRIIKTGSDKEILVLKNGSTKLIDLKGRTLIPGLHDAHVHFESGSKILKNRLSVRFMNLEEIRKIIKEVIAASPEGAVIYAYHFNHAYFKDGRWPSIKDLDDISPDNPVVIVRVDGHSSWLNSKALEQAGITKKTKDVPGGEIVRFKDGSPTGILKENAEGLVKNLKGPAMVIPGRGSKDALEMGIEYANKLGLTSVTTSGSPALIKKLEKIRKKSGLSLRFNVWFPISKLDKYLTDGYSYRKGDDFVRVSFLKIFIDGTIGSATAAMFRPYKHRPDSKGLLIYPVAEFNRMVNDAHKNNWPVGVHAIGDRGVHLVLNAVEMAVKEHGVKPGIRHRVEHAQFVVDEDIDRFLKLDMIASMQPTHCTTDLLVVEDRVDQEVAARGYRWNSFRKAGVNVAFGTDWAVEPLDPRRGLYSSIERKNIENRKPEKGWFNDEKIELKDAVKFYTHGSAFASNNEKVLGTVEVGKLADFTIFDGDLFTEAAKNPRSILSFPVYMTIVDGKVVYRR